MTSIRGRGRLGRALVVVSAAIAMLAPTVPAQAAADIPAVDEIVKSPNLQHVANLPKQTPFDQAGAYGTDLAFQDDYAYVGNYSGFTIYDISKPKRPVLVSQVLCPGSQNDVSVYRNLLFLSTDSSRSNDSCNSVGQSATVKESWEGVKIFDISDVRNPRYVKSIETDCGSHTHTLVPGKDRRTVYLYSSSYSPASRFPDCQPPHDKISIVKVPVRAPEQAALIAAPNIFPDGGNPGDGQPYPYGTSATTGCHDITVYPDKDLAAGACMGEGVLLDISDRENPKVTATARDDEHFAFWHSATFNNDGTKVVFTDELGGGGTATCDATIGDKRGANGVYDIVDGKLVFRSYFKIPRHQATTENCVAHNGSLIPVKGKDIMVQAWYQGGISVWDFTDSSNPHEFAYFERGPLSDTALTLGGVWSSYYYNGYIYNSDIEKGLDVLRLNDRRTNQARSVEVDILNAQTQYAYPERGRGHDDDDDD
ncbi:LVIVD repeat-containing protein [Sinosporangium album]|uniref:LVIVD repeat-containing protein n=2 Tax=Sinosporangium album TaxID=504805 RepID=A0A1G7VXE0_9ACTN|nr:LVIVD repeat-containing protein [Sinosporangium album]